MRILGITNIGIHTSGLTKAHSGSAWGSNVNNDGNGTSTAIIQTKEKVAYPGTFTCYISKESTNKTSSSWKIQTSSDGSSWTDIATLSSMTQNTWTKFTGDIKKAGKTNVYVRLYYSGSTAKRAVDDIELTTYVPVTIASSGYSTLGTTCGLDFASASPAGLEAYVVPSITASAVSLSDIDEAPASTGVILKGTPDETYTIPVKTTATFDGTNKLKAAVTATTLEDGTFYIMKGGKFCLVTGAANEAARTVPAGKAYLLATDVPSEARELTFVFDDVTAIETVKSEKANNEYYNLAGQRIANPTKGLYIVNGKKVIIK